MERAGVKSRWSSEPDAKAIFHAVFAEPSAADHAVIAAAYDFSRCTTVADLGGAGGALLAAILNANPNVRGILVDRKEAIDGAAPRIAAAGLSARCNLVAGDLLAAVPGGADVYIMKHVLHGYRDDDARHPQLAVQRWPPNGRLLLSTPCCRRGLTGAGPKGGANGNERPQHARRHRRPRAVRRWESLLASTSLSCAGSFQLPATITASSRLRYAR